MKRVKRGWVNSDLSMCQWPFVSLTVCSLCGRLNSAVGSPKKSRDKPKTAGLRFMASASSTPMLVSFPTYSQAKSSERSALRDRRW
ncbi:putative lipoprotein (plasmid) [Blastomonas sp. RAC04]|nr:putative lipoprotein [Blastomonas sp. RAC04]